LGEKQPDRAIPEISYLLMFIAVNGFQNEMHLLCTPGEKARRWFATPQGGPPVRLECESSVG
jgi:hypothetical protein